MYDHECNATWCIKWRTWLLCLRIKNQRQPQVACSKNLLCFCFVSHHAPACASIAENQSCRRCSASSLSSTVCAVPKSSWGIQHHKWHLNNLVTDSRVKAYLEEVAQVCFGELPESISFLLAPLELEAAMLDLLPVPVCLLL